MADGIDNLQMCPPWPESCDVAAIPLRPHPAYGMGFNSPMPLFPPIDLSPPEPEPDDWAPSGVVLSYPEDPGLEPPTLLQQRFVPTDRLVEWADNSAGEDGFVLERRDAGSVGPWAVYTVVGAGVESYIIPDPLPGVPPLGFELRVRAFAGVVVSAPSNQITVFVFDPAP